MTKLELDQLVSARRKALEADGFWGDYTDMETAEAFVRLELLQAALLEIDYKEDAARLIALGLLLENGDRPNFADDFKNRLFEALRPSNAIVAPSVAN